MRKVLSHYLGKPPLEIWLVRSKNGKPFLSRRRHCEEVHFSLSHSDSVLVVAVSRRPVGVDIEFTDRKLEFDKILNRFFPRHEFSMMRKKGMLQRRKYFFQAWTSGEARAKLKGIGLIQELDIQKKCSKIAADQVYFFTPVRGFWGAIATQSEIQRICTYVL